MTKTQSKTKVSSAAKTSPSASKGLVQKKELKKSTSDKGRVQLSARKPEKSPAKKSAAQAGKVAAKGATKAVAKPAAKNSGNNKKSLAKVMHFH